MIVVYRDHVIQVVRGARPPVCYWIFNEDGEQESGFGDTRETILQVMRRMQERVDEAVESGGWS